MSNEKIIQTLLGLENELTDIELERSIQNTNCRQALMLWVLYQNNIRCIDVYIYTQSL